MDTATPVVGSRWSVVSNRRNAGHVCVPPITDNRQPTTGMYKTCIYCNRNLGDNESVENFPVGRRLAFLGRL